MLAQIALIRPAEVIDFVKLSSAPSGFRQMTQSTSPTPMSTVLVSLFLTNKNTTAIKPMTAQISLAVAILSPFVLCFIIISNLDQICAAWVLRAKFESNLIFLFLSPIDAKSKFEGSSKTVSNLKFEPRTEND